MMENSSAITTFLIFRLGDSLFAVEARAVLEVVALPEVTPLLVTRGYIAGVTTVHGRIVPVIDLNLRFGYPRKRWRVEDCIVLVEWAGSRVGIVVNEVLKVCDIAAEDVSAVPEYAGYQQPHRHLISGLLNQDGSMITLLRLDNLLALYEGEDSIHDYGPHALAETVGLNSEFSVLERALFHQRAIDQATLCENVDEEGLLPLAVIRLSGELFAIELRSIREFAEMLAVTPIPCCPDHIVGQVNLRGDLITLIEVTAVLGLRPSPVQSGRKIVVVNNADLRVGILVDDVQDVIYLRRNDIDNAALGANAEVGRTFLQGAIAFESRMLTVLNVALLLMNKSLLVNENP